MLEPTIVSKRVKLRVREKMEKKESRKKIGRKRKRKLEIASAIQKENTAHSLWNVVAFPLASGERERERKGANSGIHTGRIEVFV